MSFGQIMGAIFGGGDVEGRIRYDQPLTPKEKLNTAFERFNETIAAKQRTQCNLKKSLAELRASSEKLKNCIQQCEDDCEQCERCREFREYTDCEDYQGLP